MKRKVRRIILDSFGFGFLTLGGIGIFVPILQGILFIIIGLYLLSINSIWFEKQLNKVIKKYPKFSLFVKSLDSKTKKILSKIGLHD